MINRHHLLICLTCLVLSGTAHAATWDDLSDQEKRILHQFEERWQNLPGERQDVLRKGASRWAKMSPDERQRTKQRFKKWRSLPKKKRDRIREHYKRFRELSSDEQARIRDARRWFKDLPEANRKKLKERWKKMTPKQRKAAINKARKHQHDRLKKRHAKKHKRKKQATN